MKTYRKIYTAAILVIILLFSQTIAGISAFASAKATISVENTAGYAGKTVDVKINIANNPGITSALLKVTYDSKLELIKVSDSGILGSAFHSDKLQSPFILSWANDTATSNFKANGTIVVLTFKISSKAAIGSELKISINYDYNNYDIINKDLNKISFETKSGKVTVSQPERAVIIGDVDDNNLIAASDARLALRASVGLEHLKERQFIAADADKNGSLTSADARLILRATVGLEKL